MFKKLKDLYKDFEDFRMIRKKLYVLDPKENEDLITYIVNRYSEENEEKINALLLSSFTRDLARWELLPDTYRGVTIAMEHRISLFRNYRKLKTNKK